MVERHWTLPVGTTAPEDLHDSYIEAWEASIGRIGWYEVPITPSGKPPNAVKRRENETQRGYYDRYMKTKRWRYVRDVRRHANWLVQGCFCGERYDLDCHHLTYDRLGGEYLEDLVFLCREHHRAVHRFYLTKQGQALGLAEATNWVSSDWHYGFNITGQFA